MCQRIPLVPAGVFTLCGSVSLELNRLVLEPFRLLFAISDLEILDAQICLCYTCVSLVQYNPEEVSLDEA